MAGASGAARIGVTAARIRDLRTARTPRIGEARAGRVPTGDETCARRAAPDRKAARAFHDCADHRTIPPHAFAGAERALLPVEGVETEE